MTDTADEALATCDACDAEVERGRLAGRGMALTWDGSALASGHTLRVRLEMLVVGDQPRFARLCSGCTADLFQGAARFLRRQD